MSNTTQKAKTVEGLAIRAATMADIPALTDMVNACSMADIGVKEVTLETMLAEAETPGFCLETDTRMFGLPDAGPIAYIEVWDVAVPPVRLYLWPKVHPQYLDLGFGEMLMEWGEARARQALARAPEGTRVVMLCSATDSDTASLRLFETCGMQLVRHFWQMETHLDDPPPAPSWPPGIELRTYDQVENPEALYRSQDDSFHDHWGHVEEDFEIAFPRWQHHIFADDKFDPSLTFLIMDGNEIAGGSICKAESDEDPSMGWVRELWVRRPWRRQGIGLALLQHSFAAFHRIGKSKAGLGVDAASLTGATRLYEKAGMSIARRWQTYELELRPGRQVATEQLEE